MFETSLKEEIIQIAEQNALEPAALLAVVWVESAGRMFARIGGRDEPLIRFEGHYFHRLLPQGKRNIAVVQRLAHPKAGRIANPYRQSGRWKMLGRAKKIDQHAALSSCSWGCGQVMGSHWQWLGYQNVEALVDQARAGASGQVSLMVRYILKAGLSEKLRCHDWAGFARRYNGPAFRRNRYDAKLKEAYRKFLSMTELDIAEKQYQSAMQYIKCSLAVAAMLFGNCKEI